LKRIILYMLTFFALTTVAFAGCKGDDQTLVASWYGAESGNRTANGEHFNGTSLTAAHRSLPFGTKLRVTYRGKSIVVRINDRGPFHRDKHGRYDRDLDLSHAVAKALGTIPAGVATVLVCRLPGR